MMASVKRRAEDSAVVERLDSDTPGPSWSRHRLILKLWAVEHTHRSKHVSNVIRYSTLCHLLYHFDTPHTLHIEMSKEAEAEAVVAV